MSPRYGRRIALAWLWLALAACREGDPTAEALRPPLGPLSGVWAGTWSGTDSHTGFVTGDWEVELTHYDTFATGAVRLGGDVDCPEGEAFGSLEGEAEGWIERAPCAAVAWRLTAVSEVERTLAGVWSNDRTRGEGAFTGLMIATHDGPRIRSVHPRAGAPGTIVTIVGESFAVEVADNALDFNTVPAAVLQAPEPGVLRVAVPAGATTGPLTLNTPLGLALSPQQFDASPTSPTPRVSAQIGLGEEATSVAISPNGRRAYVTSVGSGYVHMIDTATNEILLEKDLVPPIWTVVPTEGVAVSPDGRRVYVAAGDGVRVLDGATLDALETIAFATGVVRGDAVENPQGIAVSPDGRRLYVSDGRSGGSVSIVDLATNGIAATVAAGLDNTPRGLAVSPDGRSAYVAVAGLDAIQVFDARTGAIESVLPAGAQPIAVAITPDGRKLYAANESGNSVTMHDLVTGASATVAVGAQPAGIAASPDGSRVFVANRGGEISVLSTATDAVQTSVPLASRPVAIAISPDGRHAYATGSANATLNEIGSSATLTIAKRGTGLGDVSSLPQGINCGTGCQIGFEAGSAVTLNAYAGANSRFLGWGGDWGCGSRITLNRSMTCTATFDAIPPPPRTSGSGGGDDHCFIATAAYGSAMADDVIALRQFRDRHLRTNALGRLFIELYYDYSPQVADYIRERAALRLAVRGLLRPIVTAIEHPGRLVLVMLGAFALRWGPSARRSFMRAVLLAGLAGSGAASAAEATPPGTLDLYRVSDASLDARVPWAREAEASGSGFGLRGVMPVPRFGVVMAEFQSSRYDEDIGHDQFRLGIGSLDVVAGGGGAFAEYVRMELDGAVIEGFGLHVTIASESWRRAQFYGNAGYLALADSAETIAGWEFALGVAGRVTRRFGVFVDARATNLEGRESGLTLDFTDVRAGARMAFGEPPSGPVRR